MIILFLNKKYKFHINIDDFLLSGSKNDKSKVHTDYCLISKWKKKDRYNVNLRDLHISE